MVFTEGGLRRTPDGACFPERPYFPMLLANGQDALLINPVGSTDSITKGWFSGPLAEKASLGWHKTNRKEFTRPETHRECSLCLAELYTGHFLGTEEIVPARVEQFFDPRTATLTTNFRQYSHRDPGQLRFKVHTFLTDSHLLVERYEILETPQTPYHQEYRVRPPFDSGSHPLEERLHTPDVAFAALAGAEGIRFSYQSAGYRGICAVWVVVEGAGDMTPAGETSPECALSPRLPAGCRVTRYATVLDNEDAEDPEAALAALVEHVTRTGYAGIRQEHEDAWSEYFGRSSVDLPEDDLQHLYDTSLYVLRSVQDPDTGFLPMGLLPYQWQNCMFWDSWFASMAWLGCNRAAYACRMADFWKSRLEEGRKVAVRMGYEGARFSWTTSRERFTRDVYKVVQFHNNGVVALQVAEAAETRGDRQLLERVFPVMEDALKFLLDRLLSVENGTARLAACAGPDESTVDKKSTDTWTCAVMVKGIDYYVQACKALQKEPFRDDLTEVRVLLWEALNRNVDPQGVLQPFDGGAQPHWGCLIFPLFPDHPARDKTLEAISRYDEELDGYNTHNLVRYASRIFLWSEYWVIRILGDKADPEGWTRLRKNAKFTNRFGGMPERVTHMSELYRDWFMTAHASYLWAVHGLLVQRKDDALHVLNNLPKDWHDLSFENLTTHDGLRVSAAIKQGHLDHLDIVNDHPDPRRIELVAPGIERQAVELGHGQRWTK